MPSDVFVPSDESLPLVVVCTGCDLFLSFGALPALCDVAELIMYSTIYKIGYLQNNWKGNKRSKSKYKLTEVITNYRTFHIKIIT